MQEKNLGELLFARIHAGPVFALARIQENIFEELFSANLPYSWGNWPRCEYMPRLYSHPRRGGGVFRGRRGGKPQEGHISQKRGSWSPFVCYVFHPPQVSLLCFCCTSTHDWADQKLLWRGPEISVRVRPLVRFLQFLESGQWMTGPLHWLAFPCENPLPTIHWMPSPLLIEEPFFSLKSASSHPLPQNWLLLIANGKKCGQIWRWIRVFFSMPVGPSPIPESLT